MHIHRYSRINIAKKDNPPYWVMKCNLPNCSNYTPGISKLSFPLLMKQHSICNKCGETFELSRRALRMAKPTCDDCVDRKNEKLKSADEFFNSLMKDAVK